MATDPAVCSSDLVIRVWCRNALSLTRVDSTSNRDVSAHSDTVLVWRAPVSLGAPLTVVRSTGTVSLPTMLTQDSDADFTVGWRHVVPGGRGPSVLRAALKTGTTPDTSGVALLCSLQVGGGGSPADWNHTSQVFIKRPPLLQACLPNASAAPWVSACTRLLAPEDEGADVSGSALLRCANGTSTIVAIPPMAPPTRSTSLHAAAVPLHLRLSAPSASKTANDSLVEVMMAAAVNATKLGTIVHAFLVVEGTPNTTTALLVAKHNASGASLCNLGERCTTTHQTCMLLYTIQTNPKIVKLSLKGTVLQPQMTARIALQLNRNQKAQGVVIDADGA